MGRWLDHIDCDRCAVFFKGFFLVFSLFCRRWNKTNTFRETLHSVTGYRRPSQANRPCCCDLLIAGRDFSCHRLSSSPPFFLKKPQKNQKNGPLSLHDFWQATERLESDSPHFLPLILSSCSTFGSVSFWHKWASATLLQCWFHAANCFLPSKAILKSPPFFGDVPRQTRGIRRKNNSRPSVWQGREIGPPVRLQVKIKILMRKDEEPWSPARAEKCCCWEEDLGYGWTDWRREISTAVCARFYTILLLHGFCTAASQSLFAFFQTALCKLSEDPQPLHRKYKAAYEWWADVWKVPPVLGSVRWRWSPPPQMAREKSVRALGEEASAVS